MAVDFTQDELNVQIRVQLGFELTLGLYEGPITKKVVTEAILNQLMGRLWSIGDHIEKIDIQQLALDDGTELIDEST